ncbi:hypothetical protein R1sor_007095 [Riccia sorocarpa]|uniref:Phytocyanin domain-containing protein n=1 Tax=Riccia sorocarpa TaxID=122646 RepID=A0ABD3HS90_9MARC
MAAARSMWLLAIVLVASTMQFATAKTHLVGGVLGWTIPSTRTFYDEWAANETFAVGDKLTFVYSTGHNVYQVSAADASNCDGTNPIAKFEGANPTVLLTEAGEIHYICEVITHCSSGMKMTITVGGNGSAPLTPAAGPVLPPKVSPPAPSSKSAAAEVRSTVIMSVGSLFSLAAAALVL